MVSVFQLIGRIIAKKLSEKRWFNPLSLTRKGFTDLKEAGVNRKWRSLLVASTAACITKSLTVIVTLWSTIHCNGASWVWKPTNQKIQKMSKSLSLLKMRAIEVQKFIHRAADPKSDLRLIQSRLSMLSWFMVQSLFHHANSKGMPLLSISGSQCYLWTNRTVKLCDRTSRYNFVEWPCFDILRTCLPSFQPLPCLQAI